MSTAKRPIAVRAKLPDDVPQFFRLNVEVGDLDAATSFYTNLLGIQGRKQPGHRCYFNCGPVTLQVLDVSSIDKPHPAAKALYFTVRNLEAAFERARALNCLEREDIHDAPGCGIRRAPLGRALVLCQGPLGQSPLFCRRGYCLHWVAMRLFKARSGPDICLSD